MAKPLHVIAAIIALALGLPLRAATPADLPGLALWLRADTGVTRDETGHVAAWMDAERDNGAIQEQAASRPIVVDGVINGLPVVRFDGPSGFLQLKRTIQIGSGAVFIVARFDPRCLDGSARYLLGNDTGTNGYLISDGRGRVLGTSGAAHYQNGARVQNGHFGVDPRIFPLANAPLSAVNLFTVIGNTREKEQLAYIGQNGMNRSRSPFLGDVAELIVTTKALTLEQRRAVESYLGRKYCNWPAPETVPVAMTTDALRVLLNRATPTPGYPAVDPGRAANGVLWIGAGSQALTPGRYRLHLCLSLPRTIETLRVLARVNGVTRVIYPHEQSGMAFTDFTLDFTEDAATATDTPLVRVAWLTDPDPDAVDPAQRGDTLTNAVRLTPPYALSAQASLLAISAPYIERLCPIVITAVSADRVRYAPGERGMLRATVRNLGRDVIGAVAATVRREAVDSAPLQPTTPLSLKAGEERTLDIPFTAQGRWGAEAQVTVTADGLAERAGEAFSVGTNPFEAGMGVDFGSALHAGLKRYAGAITRARRLYATWLDLSGWSPGECAQLVPDTPAWWSAADSAREDDAGLKELVALAHNCGIAAVAGVSLNPAGPPARALAAAHPAWFHKGADGAPRPIGAWDIDALAGWNDPAWRKRHVHPGVMALAADWSQLDLITHVRAQLTDSVTRYGWDAVRFSEIPAQGEGIPRKLTTRPMVLTSDTSHAPDALLPALAGGGVFLQDGLRYWQYGTSAYRTWTEFFTRERAAAARVRGAGGHYYARLNTAFLPPAQAYYKLVYSLIAGIHPADEIDAPGCANWGKFLTRWSGMLWDPAVRDANLANRVTMAGAAVQGVLRERLVSPTRKFAILHLAVPPTDNDIGAAAFPMRPGAITVMYHPEAGTRVVRAVVVRPEALPYDTVLTVSKTGTATLPALGHWAMVIWEVEGKPTR